MSHDFTTAGSWKGTYGADGYNIINDITSYPSYASPVTVTGDTLTSWSYSANTDARAAVFHSSSNRLASSWSSTTNFTISLTLASGTHRVGLYCLDWLNAGVVQRIDISDAATGNLIDSQTVSSFKTRVWLFWNLTGNITLKFTEISGGNAFVSAITFDPVPGSALGTADTSHRAGRIARQAARLQPGRHAHRPAVSH